MEYFFLLTALTLVIATLATLLLHEQRDLGILVGIGALYYWSLYGAWFVVIDKTGGYSGKNYFYLETKMFPVALDGDYLLTIGLYGAFIIAVELTLLAFLPRLRRTQSCPLTLRHEPLLLLSFAAALASFLIIREKVSEAWALNTSAYWYTRSQTDEWFTMHQVLNRLALLPASIGFATLMAGKQSLYFRNARTGFTVFGYMLLFAVMGAFTFVLGNKNEIFVALLTGLLAYLSFVQKPKLLGAAAVLGGGFWFLYTIDYFRAAPVSSIAEVVAEHLDEATGVGQFVTSSNEAYAAHFSMYGVLSANVEPKFGYSFYALVCSIVPRILWKDRPPDIYLYYSESVGAIQNQGYSLHHATGWYLNFGTAGVILGGIVLGLVWVFCKRIRYRVTPSSGFLLRVFAPVAPCLWVAYLAPLVRAGPEGYKGFLVEGVLIPILALAIACRPRQARKRTFDIASDWSVPAWNRI
jgi:hypothetical protein